MGAVVLGIMGLVVPVGNAATPSGPGDTYSIDVRTGVVTDLTTGMVQQSQTIGQALGSEVADGGPAHVTIMVNARTGAVSGTLTGR